MLRRSKLTIAIIIVNILVKDVFVHSEWCAQEEFLKVDPCPAGFSPYVMASKCLKSGSGKAAYWEATEECQGQRARLLTLDSHLTDVAFTPTQAGGFLGYSVPMAGELMEFFKEEFWLGLSDAKEESTFLWQGIGELPFYPSATWTKWAPGQPEKNVSLDCVVRQTNTTWRVVDCSESHNFLCETFLGIMPEPPTLHVDYYRKTGYLLLGSILWARCTGFVAYRGQFWWEFYNQANNINGSSGFVTLPGHKNVDDLSEPSYMINWKTGKCGPWVMSDLEWEVAEWMHGTILSCCAVLVGNFHVCQRSPVLSVSDSLSHEDLDVGLLKTETNSRNFSLCLKVQSYQYWATLTAVVLLSGRRW